jgi:hypothetical protein
MKLRARLSVQTALTVFVVVSLTAALYYFGKKDLALGLAGVGVIITAVFPALISRTDGEVSFGVGKSDPPEKGPPKAG